MKTKVDICHIDNNRCVVRVSGFDGEEDLGSSLGEAADAEEAENRARQRLEDRQTDQKEIMGAKRPRQDPQTQQPKPTKIPSQKNPDTLEVQRAAPRASINVQANEPEQVSLEEPNEAPTDPEDWSEELTAIDMQLKHIGWNREQENTYLERAYGHGSRHKLTRYSDLVSFLNKLKSLDIGAEASSVQTPLRRSDLITQGDTMLTTLEWGQDSAKTFLQSKLGATSRQQLSDEQLLEFNMLLEEQLIAAKP